MRIKSSFKEYEVILENDLGFMDSLIMMDNSQFVIDRNVYYLYKEKFEAIPFESLILIEANEKNKVIDTALGICEKMTEIPAKRNAVLISIGGGIVQDITGFVANILYRGIKWIFVPTTLLAACDSCIGGKTSLNYKSFKNLLGTFYPPDELHICSSFFKTLSDKDFASGLGEVVKFNIMAGESGLCGIERSIDCLLERQEDVVNTFVENSLLFKKSFIEIDEFDRGERIKLNFAHTFGHAIEVITNYVIPHGTAVAIGMIMANSISMKRGILGAEFVERSCEVLRKVIDIDVSLLRVRIDEFISIMRKDKKQTGESLTAVLMSDAVDGYELIIVKDIQKEEIDFALNYFIDSYTGGKGKNE